MTDTSTKLVDLAAALLRDVPRYEPDNPLDSAPSMKDDPQGDWLSRDEVLAALTAAMDPAIAERAGEVLERLQKADEYEPLGHDGWDAADLITALLARIAAMEAQIKGLEGGIEAACDREAETERKLRTALAASETRAEAAEAVAKKLRAERDDALTFLDNAVSKAPEPLKALGKYLAGRLDEDEWPTAEQYLNAAAKACADRAEAAEAQIAALPAATVGVPLKQIGTGLYEQPAPNPAAIREAWEKAYWRMRSYAVHDNDCKLNKPPHFDGPCSCGLTAALEDALSLIQMEEQK